MSHKHSFKKHMESITDVLRAVAAKGHEAVFSFILVAGVLALKKIADASWQEALVVVLCSVVLYVLHLLIYEFRTRRIVTKRLPWLYSTETKSVGRLLREIEQNVEDDAIVYLVTPDLYNDARRESTRDMVRRNLTKGVNYIYITQNSDPAAKKNIDIVHLHFARFDDKVRIYALNALFGLIPTCNILVLENDSSGKLRVFVELPVTDLSDTRGLRHLWAEADKELANQWHDRIHSMLKGCTPLANPYNTNKPLSLFARKRIPSFFKWSLDYCLHRNKKIAKK